MTHFKYLSTVILMVLVSQCIFGQDNLKEGVALIAKFDSLHKKVSLRWAPTTAGTWMLSMKSGYKLERLEINDGDIGNTIYDVLAPKILPWPIEQWRSITEPVIDDDYAAIAAQMVHGKTWSADERSGIADRANQFQNRYAYHVMACDFSANAAIASGLRYEDTLVERDKKYLYRVISLAKDERFTIDTGYFYIETKFETPKQIPQFFSAIPGEHSVKLLWNRAFNKTNFTAFNIERSEDGVKYTKLNESPYISNNNENDSISTVNYYYLDSLPENYKNYYYRITGITPFAETSPPSDFLVARGIDLTPPPAPYEVKTTQLGPNRVKIEWEFDQNYAGEIRGFMIGHSYDVQQGYLPASEFLGPQVRSFVHENAFSQYPNFYIIAAIDTAGNTSYSTETYAHLIDSIPPDAPEGLKAVVDSAGLVLLTWNPSKNEDFMGYSVHFANDSTHSFVNLTNIPISKNHFTDTIQILNLGEEVYYKVVAIDKNYNYSSYSKTLLVKKPDLIPPSAPAFSGFENEGFDLVLKWSNSSSNDVVKHELWVSENGDSKKLLASYTTGNINQTTLKLKPETEYLFELTAIDDAGNNSTCLVPFRYKTKALLPDGSSINLRATKNDGSVLLVWNKQPDAVSYKVYKADSSNRYLLLKKTVENSFEDKNTNLNSANEYTIKAVFLNGAESEFSNKVFVK